MTNDHLLMRRGVMTAIAAAAASLAVSRPGQAQTQTSSGAKTFVLVHGSWHGGWCWRRVSDLLESDGHRVFRPTLTGVADRSHLLTNKVDLSTHITDIVNLVKWEELNNFVLVGHSYGGMVITGVAEQIGDKISSIVYLDAFVPGDNQSIVDLGGVVPTSDFIPPIPAAVFKVNEKDRDWVNRQMTLMPAAASTERIKVTGAYEKIASKTYIRNSTYNSPIFKKNYDKFSADPSWKTYEIDSGHDTMLDHPKELAQILTRST